MNYSQLEKIDGWTNTGRSDSPYFAILSTDSAKCRVGKKRFNYVVSATFGSATDSISPAELLAKSSVLRTELSNSINQILRECKHR